MYEFQNVRIGWEGFRMSVFPCIPSEYHSLQLADLSLFELAMVQESPKVDQGSIVRVTQIWINFKMYALAGKVFV